MPLPPTKNSLPYTRKINYSSLSLSLFVFVFVSVFSLSYQRLAATVPLPPRTLSSTHAKLNQFQLAQLELLVQYFLTLLQIMAMINDYMTKARVFVLILVSGENINFMV